jgi:hypothetical protein
MTFRAPSDRDLERRLAELDYEIARLIASHPGLPFDVLRSLLEAQINLRRARGLPPA